MADSLVKASFAAPSTRRLRMSMFLPGPSTFQNAAVRRRSLIKLAPAEAASVPKLPGFSLFSQAISETEDYSERLRPRSHPVRRAEPALFADPHEPLVLCPRYRAA